MFHSVINGRGGGDGGGGGRGGATPLPPPGGGGATSEGGGAGGGPFLLSPVATPSPLPLPSSSLFALLFCSQVSSEEDACTTQGILEIKFLERGQNLLIHYS